VDEGDTWKTALVVVTPVTFSPVIVGLEQLEEELDVSLTE
jgi:hypothetical protein